MSSASASRRRVLIAGVLGWIGLVLVLTLVPARATPAGAEASSRFCLACGPRGSADLLLNIALFAPFGWGVARGWGWRTALVAGVGLSLGIELAQLLVPGRFSNPGDVLANGAGAGLGAWVCVREARVLPGLAVAAWMAAVVPSLLLAPAPPEGVYHGQWTARFGNMAPYEGRVLEATVGGVATPSRRSGHSGALRAALRADGPVDVTFVAGPAPASLAPVFSIFDGRRRRIFLLGIDGRDVVVHRWTVATTLRLDSPALRWPGAMADVPSGDTVEIGFARGEKTPCLTVNGRSECDTAIGADAGWTLLFSPEGLTRGPTRAIGALWMFALGGLIGLAPWRPAVRGTAVATAAVLALALPAGLPYLSMSVVSAVTLGLGAGIALLLRRAMVSP